MKVLMITGDKNFSMSPRFVLQATQVEKLTVVYWGRGSFWPAIPTGPYGVVTVQDPFLRGLFAWLIARRLQATLNVQVHTDLSAQNIFRRVLAAMLLRCTDSVRVVSEKLREQVRAMRVNAPIHVLPIYVDVDRFRGLVPEPHAQKTILWIGRFEREKDPLYAAQVLQEVRGEGVDAKLVMLGTGSLETALRGLTRVLPIELLGWQDPVPYLQVADVVLCTSKHESWGASIVEALAAGCPVVAPDVGIAKEAGAIVVPRAALAHAVSDVLRSGTRGALKLSMPKADEWARRWRETLL